MWAAAPFSARGRGYESGQARFFFWRKLQKDSINHYIYPANQMLSPNGHVSDLLSAEGLKWNVRQERFSFHSTQDAINAAAGLP